MEITRDQVDAWSTREENHRWEAAIGPLYKRPDGTVDIEGLHEVAILNGLLDTRSRYEGLNTGQVAMNIRNRLRPLWLRNEFKTPNG